MSDQAPDDASAGELQFDKAELAESSSGVPTCAACQQDINQHYFQVNGQVLCEPCCEAVKGHLTGGSPFRRFLKAGAFGFGAAIAGFAIYFGVLKLTGYEIGLISILVGYMVGAAVRNGSEGRGGVLYQLMAVFFTYLAIAVSYSALVIPQVIAQMKEAKEAAVQPENGAAAPADADGKVALDARPAAAQGAEKAAMTGAEFAIGCVVLLAIMLALPVITGFSQPVGLLIVGFALWEAFKMNKKVNHVFTGPHHVGPAIEPSPAHA